MKAARTAPQPVRPGMNRYANMALGVIAGACSVLGIFVVSPPLFYMSATIVSVLFASWLQAKLATRNLQIDRIAPPAVQIGQRVSIEMIVMSTQRLQRPLVTIVDQVPLRLTPGHRPEAMPVAPSFDQPIRTRYFLQPMHRGRFRWSKALVVGTDALGLRSVTRELSLDPVELTVHPAPIPVSVEVRPLAGWGTSELDTGRIVGAGLDTRGLREYVPGDPLKIIDWKASARTSKLISKEFDTGSGVRLKMALQNHAGSEAGPDGFSSFEAMCGHALFLAEHHLKRGVTVVMPQSEPDQEGQGHPSARERSIREHLTDIQPTSGRTLFEQMKDMEDRIQPGDTWLLFLCAAEPELPELMMRHPDTAFIALIYSPGPYGPMKMPPAESDSFLAELERAGAQTVVMPHVEAPTWAG